MYTVRCETDGVSYPLMNVKVSVINPVVTEYAGNTPDAFTFEIPASHDAYRHVVPFKTYVYVSEGSEVVYSGRVTSITNGFGLTKSVTCEGVLGYLYDSCLRPYVFTGTLTEYIQELLNAHNEQVDDSKHFSPGTVDVAKYAGDKFTVEENGYTSPLNALSDIVEKYGGYLKSRWENGVRYLDYKDSFGTNTQVIQYGKNMLSMEQNRDINDFFTALIPIGGSVEVESSSEKGSSISEDVTIKSVNGGVDYIYDEDAVKEYGWIYRQESWSDITDPTTLLEKAKERLLKVIYLGANLSITAIDMMDLGADVTRLKVGCDTVVKSVPHGIDAHYLLAQRTRNLTDPSKDTFSLGAEESSITTQGVTTKAGAKHDNENLNASNIKGGDLVLGGTKINKYGSIIIKSPSDKEIGRWNKDGFYVSQGEINLLRKENIGLYIKDSDFKFGDFEIGDGYGRQILQSSDEVTGISGEPNEKGQLYMWAGWDGTKAVFAVNNLGRVVIHGDLRINGTLSLNGVDVGSALESIDDDDDD